MKKLFKILSLAIFIAVFSSLSSNAQITIPAGTTVTVTDWVSNEYIVYGTLKSNESTGFGARLTVKNGGKVIINGEFKAYGPQITVEISGEIKAASLGVAGSATNPFIIHGKVSISGNATINGYLELHPGGELNATNINFSSPNNLIAGTVNASGWVKFNQPTNTMDCGLIYTKDFINASEPNPLTGTGYIKVTGSYTSANALTNSSTIILDLPGGVVPAGQNKGAATLGTTRPCGAFPLPVTFGAVNAFVTNGNSLSVSWNTLNETNNNHFEIEVSKDGRNFTKIGEVKSNATNGNSTSDIEYTFTQHIPAKAIAGGLALMLLAGGTMMYRRRKYAMLSILSLAFLSATLFSCSKSDHAIETSADQTVFVRITQVDIDGKTASSKIVKALVK